MRVETKGAKGPGDSWEDAVFKAGPSVGHRLFEGAADNGFDKEIVRDYARCLMRFANGDVEDGYTGIYEGRRSEIGHFETAVTPRTNILFHPFFGFLLKLLIREASSHLIEYLDPFRNRQRFRFRSGNVIKVRRI